MRRILIAALVAVVLFVILVMVGTTPDSTPARHRTPVRIGTAECVVRTPSGVVPCN